MSIGYINTLDNNIGGLNIHTFAFRIEEPFTLDKNTEIFDIPGFIEYTRNMTRILAGKIDEKEKWLYDMKILCNVDSQNPGSANGGSSMYSIHCNKPALVGLIYPVMPEHYPIIEVNCTAEMPAFLVVQCVDYPIDN